MENKKLKRGQELELTISDIAFGGQGISKYNDLIFFIKDAIPNQRIIARISRVKKKYVEAFKVKILTNILQLFHIHCHILSISYPIPIIRYASL